MTIPVAVASVSHNQIGQKLGRKGQETRERILSAMLRLLDDPDGPPVTLTSVANEASIRLTNLYLYFPDIGQLLLAALVRVMDTAGASYLDRLAQRWPDELLEQCCLDFLTAHYEFWKRNARILHMRNALADANDLRVMTYRNTATEPLIDLLAAQMDCPPDEDEDGRSTQVAIVLLTGLERVATVVTNPHFVLISRKKAAIDRENFVAGLLAAEAEVIANAIRHRRAALA
ncbi:MAG: TetR/AcrR family transcriptional regulator [Novosphingobium sp.]